MSKGSPANWSRAPLGSLAGNLPEILMRDVMAPSNRTILVEDRRPNSKFEHLDQGSRRYVQVLADMDGDVFVECVSNEFLDEDDHLTLDDELRLLELGFTPPSERPGGIPNWYWHPETQGEALEACIKMLRVLTDIFGIGLNQDVWFKQQDLGTHAEKL